MYINTTSRAVSQTESFSNIGPASALVNDSQNRNEQVVLRMKAIYHSIWVVTKNQITRRNYLLRLMREESSITHILVDMVPKSSIVDKLVKEIFRSKHEVVLWNLQPVAIIEVPCRTDSSNILDSIVYILSVAEGARANWDWGSVPIAKGKAKRSI